jgi:ABC-type uncharacterized transport system permease subunit
VMGAGAFVAITSGSGWWVVGLVAVLFGTHVYLSRHFRRRAELLENAPQR